MNQPEKLVVFFCRAQLAIEVTWQRSWSTAVRDQLSMGQVASLPREIKRAGADRQEVPWWRAGEWLASVVHIKIDGIYGSSH